MLIVGGGPAGAAAAVYAARKGIRTGIVAERFGGQTLDTLGIENYISVLETDGPKFAAALEAHVRAYDVDIMNGQRVEALEPAAQPGGLAGVRLANGATLQARSVILSTGARWKNVNVPGEAEYRTKGVAYCPHCDGPLFKGKKVAVIGGGNSGVEAAIDLAGVVQHVTLIEFMDQLKADAVLVKKLLSLPNVTVHANAQTLEITGDGQKVNGLRFKDRASGAEQRVDLAGVFVQIGLVPNTEFLKGTIELSRYGEILVDDRGATSVPGVFAAGDATTVPFKQIVIAAGDGAKAALAAVRLPDPHAGGLRRRFGLAPRAPPAVRRIQRQSGPDEAEAEQACAVEGLMEDPHAQRQLDRRRQVLQQSDRGQRQAACAGGEEQQGQRGQRPADQQPGVQRQVALGHRAAAAQRPPGQQRHAPPAPAAASPAPALPARPGSRSCASARTGRSSAASTSAIHGRRPFSTREPQHAGGGQRHRGPLHAVQALVQHQHAEQHVDDRVDEVAQAGLDHLAALDRIHVEQPVDRQQQRTQRQTAPAGAAARPVRASSRSRAAAPARRPRRAVDQTERCSTTSSGGTEAICRKYSGNRPHMTKARVA